MARSLAKYKAKRDFELTDEPSDKSKLKTTGHDFVIQKHAARRLHYDFRLELDGVLLSWSVPKGPSLDPGDRRLAVRTEDHPLAYADFEGTIPKGQYGGGTVVVWDRGTWQPEGDARKGLEKGRLSFSLAGEKLHGKWHLVRTRGDGKAETWLLFKSKDEAANDKLDITESKPASVVTGRTIEQVAEAQDRVWSSAKPEDIIKQLPLGFPLTSLDKVLYPGQGITKGQLIAYLAVVSERMLPRLAGRPLMLVRCPGGQGKPCFFQKHVLKGSPDAIHRVDVGEEAPYMMVDDLPGLVGVAQMGTLELHTWGSQMKKLEKPDMFVLDLDPDVGLAWDRVALAAFEVRKRLNAMGLASWVKTTGGKGLHVVVPLAPKLDWDGVKQFTKQFAETLDGKQFTSKLSKAARKGKIFLDYLRNARGATFIAPYSPRARAGAPVATPITWEELAGGIDPAAFDTQTVPARLSKPDPWADMEPQTIGAAAWKAVGGKP